MSLLVRFFAVSLLIAGVSIGVTAWLASQATTGSIRQEQGEALTTDAQLYDRLLGHAAEHRDWSAAQPVVDRLAAETGRRIALTTGDRVVLADSAGPGAPPLPVDATVVVDPLNVNRVLKPGGTDEIDPRAVGPFQLTPQEQDALRAQADAAVRCYGGTVVLSPGGRPEVTPSDPVPPSPDCEVDLALLHAATRTEAAASDALIALVQNCLARTSGDARPLPRWINSGDPRWYRRPWRDQSSAQAACLASARREQLAPWVAPPALLFLTAPTGAERPVVDLSTAGVARIALTALGILVLAGVAAWLTALHLVRPIRALTAATQRMSAGHREVRVRAATGEIGELARSFNVMSARLADTERQRQALVSDVAHELRTPLSNVTGWLEAAQDGIAPADQRLVSLLLEESLVLQRLVDDLHELAQADAGTLRLHPEPVDAAEVVDQVVAAHHALAAAGCVALTARTGDGAFLLADPVRLRQAVGNLVANAIRYTPEGGSVTVEGRAEADLVVVEVSDTGVGIAPEDLPRVFDRFWRADRSRSRSTGGSGLGLTITRHLVQAHGGTVSASSTPGSGTTFRIALPADVTTPRS
ncbi:sensor histidine kinase [Umezawaea beigongshangensis]|uniref:sensor histidine kinase n=1 Tax=Umezawaea beigongshangensis TaxID=2780383 RepID=UPI0018F2040A|nr:HAMP domain-containing sensor histidine kinase [Umezawaea beigongshangensis]